MATPLVPASEPASHISGIYRLPTEILADIFSYLDTSSPSSFRLYEQPYCDLTRSEVTDLKSVSSVSRRWRSLVLRILFRHARFKLRSTSSIVRRSEVNAFVRFVKRNELRSLIETFTLVSEDSKETLDARPENAAIDFDDEWESIFTTLDPVRLTIVAPPLVLAALTSCDAPKTWIHDFHMPYHVLSLSRAGPTSVAESALDARPGRRRGVLARRAWSAVLLNEGSFQRARARYGPQAVSLTPPSILPELVRTEGGGGGAPRPRLPPSVQRFEYVAIFPFPAHLAEAARLLPRLRRLRVQCLPRGDVRADPAQRGAVADMRDVADDVAEGYRLLLGELGDAALRSLFRLLEEVELPDAAADAWAMGAIKASVPSFGGRWRFDEEERRLVRNRGQHTNT